MYEDKKKGKSCPNERRKREEFLVQIKKKEGTGFDFQYILYIIYILYRIASTKKAPNQMDLFVMPVLKCADLLFPSHSYVFFNEFVHFQVFAPNFRNFLLKSTQSVVHKNVSR